MACGVGESVDRDASPDTVGAALGRVIASSAYRDQAGGFARDYDPDASGAVGALEAVVSDG